MGARDAPAAAASAADFEPSGDPAPDDDDGDDDSIDSSDSRRSHWLGRMPSDSCVLRCRCGSADSTNGETRRSAALEAPPGVAGDRWKLEK